MTHAEAVAIIRAPRRDGPESYLLYSAACAKVYVDHMQQTRPGTFTRDVGEPSPNWRTARSNPDATASSARSDMGRDPESRSGARLVQILDGPVTSYFVASDGQGRACLYQSSDVDDAIDCPPHATGVASSRHRRPHAVDEGCADPRRARTVSECVDCVADAGILGRFAPPPTPATKRRSRKAASARRPRRFGGSNRRGRPDGGKRLREARSPRAGRARRGQYRSAAFQ